MGKLENITAFELDEASRAVTPTWMLVDWQQNCRVVAAGGKRLPWHIGDELGWETVGEHGVGRWLEERWFDLLTDAYLIPLSGQVWLAFPQCYLSTGCLMLLHLPAPANQCRAWAMSGVFGAVSIFPDLPMLCEGESGELDRSAAEDMCAAVLACLPRHPVQDEHEEMTRLLCAVAALHGLCPEGILPHEIPPRNSEEAEEVAQAFQDLRMFSVMLTVLLGEIGHGRLRRFGVDCDMIDEGLAVTLKLPLPSRGALADESDGIAFCRALAEQNGQIFSCTAEGNIRQCTMCTVRKEFSLLGVKAEPPITPTEDIESMRKEFY